jgi:fatty acid amide hydrolase 2
VANAVQTAAAALRTVGMIHKRAPLPMMKAALEFTAIMYREWLPDFRIALGGGQPLHFWSELLDHFRGKNRVSATCLSPLATFTFCGPILRLLGHGEFDSLNKLRQYILDSMGEGSVALWPVFPTTAPKHGFAWKPHRSPTYTAIFNSLGFPAIAMPLGLSAEGLPLSVQLIGQPNQDETILAVAAVLERIFGGWRLAVTGVPK